jgi:hypothetical protein
MPRPRHERARLVLAQAVYGTSAAAAAAFVAADFFASLSQRARRRAEKGWPAANSMLIHSSRELVLRQQAGRPRQRVRLTSPSASYSRPADCGLPMATDGALSIVRH